MYVDEFDLTLTGDTFNALKSDFNQVLRKTLTNMEAKGSELAELTIKLKITLKRDTAPDFTSQVESRRDIVVPKFDHKVSSVMQIKDEVTGSLGGDYELVWDESRGEYVMRKIVSNQMNIFDCVNADYTVVDDNKQPEGENEAIEGRTYPALLPGAEDDSTDDEESSDNDSPAPDNEDGVSDNEEPVSDDTGDAEIPVDDGRLTDYESCKLSFPSCLCVKCMKYKEAESHEDEDCCQIHGRDCRDANPCPDFVGKSDQQQPTDAEKRKAAINKALGIIKDAAGSDEGTEDDGYVYDEPEDHAV